ncbi:hypothetical protein Tcan_08949 [Toxocara canis]|uniref:Uncharacterized protein n=1 Tax=Toxocara canis TaxID=6265 RepID=A0A0B2VXV1_TOXCA|nr:hypothetical protein Tcan_08949 [Toxocara canis]
MKYFTGIVSSKAPVSMSFIRMAGLNEHNLLRVASTARQLRANPCVPSRPVDSSIPYLFLCGQ